LGLEGGHGRGPPWVRVLVLGASVGSQALVRCVPSVRQTRMSVGRRVVMWVVILRDMGPPGCMRLHASGGDVEGVLVGTC
jgi:hypothetical protein